MKELHKNVSIIFPAHNEEENIGEIISNASKLLLEFTNEWEIVVVDDGSRDKTAKIVKECSARDKRVRLISHNCNMGYGAAVRTGIISSKKELCFLTDADLQFDMREIHKMLQWIDENDIVIGYREKRQDPLYRRINGFCWNIVVRLCFGLKVKDVDCAFKLFRRQIFDDMNMESEGAMISTEILLKAIKKGCKIKEVPVTHFPRQKGKQSGANLRVILKAFKELVRLRKRLKIK